MLVTRRRQCPSVPQLPGLLRTWWRPSGVSWEAVNIQYSGFRGVIVVTRARAHASLKDLNCAEIIVLEEPGLHHQTHPTSWPLSVTLVFLFGIQLSRMWLHDRGVLSTLGPHMLLNVTLEYSYFSLSPHTFLIWTCCTAGNVWPALCHLVFVHQCFWYLGIENLMAQSMAYNLSSEI